MFNMHSLEHELLEMKANTLYKYGKKVELAEEMLQQKTVIKERLEKILHKLETTTVIKHGWGRKKRQEKLTERVRLKLTRTTKQIAKLEELKKRYIEEFKFQREACGICDHRFIDDFYHD